MSARRVARPTRDGSYAGRRAGEAQLLAGSAGVQPGREVGLAEADPLGAVDNWRRAIFQRVECIALQLGWRIEGFVRLAAALSDEQGPGGRWLTKRGRVKASGETRRDGGRDELAWI
jgi:hypothetical protein